MTDEELKRLLDGIGPEQGPEVVDPRWEALAMGEVDEVEAERLAVLAATEQGRMRTELMEPLGEDFKQRTAARLLVMRPPNPAPVALAALAERRAASGPSWWASLWAWWRTPMVWGPVLAVAVALLVFLPSATEPLPGYALELRMGDRVERGAAERVGSAKVSAGSAVELILRPDEAVVGAVSAQVVQVVGGVERPIGLRVQVDPRGAVRVTGTVGEEIGAEVGPVELRVRLTRGDGGEDEVVVPVRFDVVP